MIKKGGQMINEKDIGERIAKNIRLIIVDKGLTQAEVAKNMGYTRSAVNNLISSIEQGKGTFKTICRYANALGVSLEDLICETKLTKKRNKA